jgi:hypothetical protein
MSSSKAHSSISTDRLDLRTGSALLADTVHLCCHSSGTTPGRPMRFERSLQFDSMFTLIPLPPYPSMRSRRSGPVALIDAAGPIGHGSQLRPTDGTVSTTPQAVQHMLTAWSANSLFYSANRAASKPRYRGCWVSSRDSSPRRFEPRGAGRGRRQGTSDQVRVDCR